MKNGFINKGNYPMETDIRIRKYVENISKGWEHEYNEYRSKWIECPSKGIVLEYPLLVDIELSSICNLRCPMCYTITEDFKKDVAKGLMDYDLFRKIIDEIHEKVPAIRLSLRGEPTLHDKFVDCIKYAKDAGVREISFLTNGSKLTEKYFKEIMFAGADWITISIDGLGEIYEQIRRPLKFLDTLNRVKAIKRIKDANNFVKPAIKIQSIWPAIRNNPEEYYNTFVNYVDLIAYNPLIDYLENDNVDDIIYEKHFSCPQLYQRLVIGSDGYALACSNDEKGLMKVGNANDVSISDIWHGDKINKLREQYKCSNGFKGISICKRCYLPRATENKERCLIHNDNFVVSNYINREQEYGK